MRLIFVDDSVQTNPPRAGLGQLVSIGAVVFPEDQARPFADALVQIRTDLGIPPEEELKWKPARGSFLAQAGGDLVRDLRLRMLEAAAEFEVKSAVVVIDHGSVYRSDTAAQVGSRILPWLYERIEMLLTDTNDLGIVVADEPGGGTRAERTWLAETLALTDQGTRYVTAERVVMPIVTARPLITSRSSNWLIW
jgi:hypothetical protein